MVAYAGFIAKAVPKLARMGTKMFKAGRKNAVKTFKTAKKQAKGTHKVFQKQGAKEGMKHIGKGAWAGTKGVGNLAMKGLDSKVGTAAFVGPALIAKPKPKIPTIKTQGNV